MIKSFKLLAVLLAAVSINLGMMDFAEAKRFGSGGSFGSKFSQSNTIKKNNVQREQTAPSTAQTTNQARKQQLAGKGGLMGILGGLAIGGLLGALFFGGAFEGINFLDIVLFGLLGFLAYKLLFARRNSQETLNPAVAGGGRYAGETDIQRETLDAGAPEPSQNLQQSYGNAASLDDLRGTIPKNFDQPAFLNGAKTCFKRLQHAWDTGDLADIRQYTTDHVFAEVQDQHRTKTQPSHTEILELNAEILKVEELGSKSEATVLFDANLREDGMESHVSEVWHFTKPSASLQPTWFVDGIQQVEN